MSVILPAAQRFPQEFAIAGRLVIAYGELEFDLLQCVSIPYTVSTIAKVMYRTRSEEQRLKVADALVRPYFKLCGLADQGGLYCQVYSDLGYCRRVRNLYAHSHFGDDAHGLFLVRVEGFAQSNTDDMGLKRYPVRAALLESQETYFHYVQQSLWYLTYRLCTYMGKTTHRVPEPPARMPRPPLHSPGL